MLGISHLAFFDDLITFEAAKVNGKSVQENVSMNTGKVRRLIGKKSCTYSALLLKVKLMPNEVNTY